MSTKTKGSKDKGDTKLSEEQRLQHIEVAAYYIAERGGFDCSCDLENWLAAEAEIDRLLVERN